MNLIDLQGYEYEFFIETLDDLWVLSNFINPNDFIFAKTERKVKIGSETAYKVVRKLIFVELLVKNVIYSVNTLKISGEIQNETEYTSKGSSHTLSFTTSDKIRIKKSNILKYEEDMIKKSLNDKKEHNLCILLDKDSLIVFEFTNFAYKILLDIKNLGSKKYMLSEIDEEHEKYELLKDLFLKNYSNIIISGPGIYKDKFQKYIKDNLNIKTHVFLFSDVSQSSITNLIKDISKSDLISKSQIYYESEYINQLLLNINQKSKYCYGYKNVKESINSGSCSILLISTVFINSAKSNGEYNELNDLIKLAEELNGKLIIINSENQSGSILDGLGGIAGILRY